MNKLTEISTVKMMKRRSRNRVQGGGMARIYTSRTVLKGKVLLPFSADSNDTILGWSGDAGAAAAWHSRHVMMVDWITQYNAL